MMSAVVVQSRYRDISPSGREVRMPARKPTTTVSSAEPSASASAMDPIWFMQTPC